MSSLDSRIQYVADEIAEEIMLKLPVKSLVRFMCVSKSYYTLIRSSSFVSKHTRSVINRSKENPSLVTVVHVRDGDDFDVRLLHRKYDEYNDFVVDIEEMCFMPPPTIEYEKKAEDFCHGLLCIHTAGICVLWNPSLMKALEIPLPATRSVGSEFVGLCYDYVSHGYKLVFIEQTCFDARKAKVYELSKKEWRKISSSPAGDMQHHQPALVKGALHWVGVHDVTTRCLVIVFDVSSEVFGDMDLPFHASLSDKFSKVVSLGESLACFYGHWDSKLWDIWVMKQYGVSSSWTKMFRLDLGVLRLSYPTLRLSKKNQLLVLKRNELLVFDTGNEKPVSCHSLGSLNTSLRTFEYMETLALLDYTTQRNYD
ncbi:hypothetical protein K2173_023951 [Erythroxylum novogranatense]|uniref:F-box domain-containing protein n=1 Tax=Erythroxylum novogranatense TaxID=1862640 RepID=A0AAV8TPV6_9ROSI|nr:hypothetical protein K2173_023951 [Erythroxylum novogranatense]